MSADDESDWSDSSAGSVASSFSTSVMLGLPDGAIESATDLADACVSRLGGPPAFLPTLRAFPDPKTAACCPTCARPAELLLQLYAPLEGSVDDRVVYVFGCARAGCQGEAGGSKKGSLRAFSSIVRNDRFASAHERRAAKKAAKAQAAAASSSHAQAAVAPAAGFNPFAASAAAAGPGPSSSAPFNPFAAPAPGQGAAGAAAANPFAAAGPPNPFASPSPAPASASAPADDAMTAVDALTKETSELALGGGAPASAAEGGVADSDEDDEEGDDEGSRPTPDPAWSTVPAYPAQYLSTQTEFLSRPKLSKKQKAAQDAHLAEVAGMDDAAKRKALEEFDQEYVKGSGIPGADETFERFLDRLQDEPSQVVRYDFGGQPLPYSSTSKVHATLFGAKPAAGAKRGGVYDRASVPACERCGGPRAFEMQLVPGLLNLLRPEQIAAASALSSSSTTTATAADVAGDDEARRREVERLLSARRKADEQTGMEWGVVDMFSCEAGCGGPWAEEFVAVEWEE